jgi:hypothetical protein
VATDDWSAYDRAAWEHLHQWRERRMARAERHLLPRRARETLTKAREATRDRLNRSYAVFSASFVC